MTLSIGSISCELRLIVKKKSLILFIENLLVVYESYGFIKS